MNEEKDNIKEEPEAETPNQEKSQEESPVEAPIEASAEAAVTSEENSEDEEDADDLGESDSKDDEYHAYDDDPLALGYDMQRGAPLDDSYEQEKVRGLPSSNKVETVNEFFNTEFVYRYDILEDEDRDSQKGKYRFEFGGEENKVWTVSIDDDFEVKNSNEEAGIVMSVAEKDFLNLVNGEINPQLAILAGKLKIEGDLGKAINLLDLLVPDAD